MHNHSCSTVQSEQATDGTCFDLEIIKMEDCSRVPVNSDSLVTLTLI